MFTFCLRECPNTAHWIILEEIYVICISSRRRKDREETFAKAVELRCLCRLLAKIDIPTSEVGDVLSVLHNCLQKLPTMSISQVLQSIREKALC